MNYEFEYKLPGTNNSVETYKTKNNSLIIIGANGSGKSRLGAWIENQNRAGIHRIGAQRSLQWKENLVPKSFELLLNTFLYGGENLNEKNTQFNFSGGKDGSTTTERKDIESVLSAIFSKRTVQLEEFDERAKDAPDQTLKRENNIVDDIQRIWSAVFPHRAISFKDLKIFANINSKEYNGVGMSDGERVALYLISQTLLIPANKTIIIDEPEIHLHRSIMNQLWTELEKERKDCLFIYITHDTQFAANHKQAEKIWVKNYDGNFWIWEEIKESALPEQLLLDVLGSRKKVLFVEGDSNSYDVKLYREIYSNYYVIPCGGCSSVIAQTKAMRNTQQLHEFTCFGLIDRDYRSETELNAYKANNIFSVNVAEIENIFLIDGLFKIVNSILAIEDEANIEKIKNHIIEERFSKEINKIILESTVSEIKYQLSTIHIPNDEISAKQKLAGLSNEIDFDKIRMNQEQLFNEILSNKDYMQVLSVFNRKDVVKYIGSYFGLKNNEYCELIIRHLQGEKTRDIISLIKPYLPTEIPID
jgi:ABC-type cobalamin/Fe3+-siderophores transport system ATPase subunit